MYNNTINSYRKRTDIEFQIQSGQGFDQIFCLNCFPFRHVANADAATMKEKVVE